MPVMCGCLANAHRDSQMCNGRKDLGLASDHVCGPATVSVGTFKYNGCLAQRKRDEERGGQLVKPDCGEWSGRYVGELACVV